MSAKHIARIANRLTLSMEEAAAYCEEVRRASGFGRQLSDQTIARHLRNKKPPYPEPGVLAAIIRQQESFRIITGNRFPAKKASTEVPPTQKSQPPKSYTSQVRDRPIEQNLRTPLLDGVEVQSPELIRELKRRVIDEHGFLVSTDLIPEINVENDQNRHFHRSASKQNVEPLNVFDTIKSLDAGIPGARTKKLRPKPDQQVLCPICHRHVEYQNLFDHVGKWHPEKNAKSVLARFNRDYEIWAKNRSKSR